MTATSTPLDAARRLYERGEHAAAVARLSELLAGEPANAAALELLSLSLRALGRHAQALDAIRAALRLAPDDPVLLTNAGAVALAAGAAEEAEALYHRAIVQNPQHVDAYANLALLLDQTGRSESAEIMLEKAIAIAPDSSRLRTTLGAMLRHWGRDDEAVAVYEQAVALRPEQADLLNGLAAALRGADRYEEALVAVDRALALRPDYERALFNRGLILARQSYTDAAAEAFDSAIAKKPSPLFRLARACLMPIVPRSETEISLWRERMEAGFDTLIAEGATLDRFPPGVVPMTFYMAYHGENNRDLIAKIARFYAQASPDLVWNAPAAARPRSRSRRRIGIASHYLRAHAVSATLLGLLQDMPRQRLELVALPLGGDNLAPEVRAAVDGVVPLDGGLLSARARLAEVECDVLLYSDIGMHTASYWLAFARLAPTQCAIWGHPDTTGLPTMDYFISNDLAEPADAQAHYTEKLVRLPGVQTCYRRPPLPNPMRPREAFGLPDDATLYLCPQSLFKLHPAMDPALADILRGDERGRLVVFEHPARAVTAALLNRWAAAFPDVASRVQVLPRVRFSDFLNILALADVLLDTWPFGGGNTSFQAIALGVPHVTLPHRFIRGRGTWALYRHMSMDLCVAADPADYVRIALRLGRDRDFRQAVSAAIRERSFAVFDDQRVVRGLGEFLTEVGV